MATHASAAAAAVAAVVLVTGDEPLLVDRAIAATVARLRKREPEVEKREAPAAGLSPAEFADLVAPSLFAEPRVVIIRGAHEANKDLATELISYLADPVEGLPSSFNTVAAPATRPSPMPASRPAHGPSSAAKSPSRPSVVNLSNRK